MNLQKRRVLYTKLNKLKPSDRSRYIRDISECELLALCEVFKKNLSGKLKCDKLSVKRVNKFKNIVSDLARKGTRSQKRKHLLTSARGSHLLSILLPLATELLGKLIN